MANRKPRKGADGEHLFAELIAAMKQKPQYISGDDDMTTTRGVLQTALYYIHRMQGDLEAKGG